MRMSKTMPCPSLTSIAFRLSTIHALALTVFWVGPVNRVNAEDWPCWAGRQHDAKSTETGFAESWPAEGLPLEWSRQIGTGFSSVAIAGERLFTMGHNEGTETVWCLNSSDGDVLWTHEYPSELIPNLHEGGPCSTPTVDGDRVYTLGKEGQLYCLNVTNGKVLWKCMLQEELGVKLPEWGFSNSALILNHMLILETGRVVAFNKITGKKLWQTEIHAAGYGSATAFRHDGRTLLATVDCNGLRIVDSENGRQIAFADWKSPYLTNATTPIVVDDQIFVSTGYKVGCGLFRLQNDELKSIYKNTDMKNHFNNSVLLDGLLYGFDGDAHRGHSVTLNCIAFETGDLAWKQRGFGCGSLMAVDGKLLILSENGELVLAKANSTAFQELARSPFLEGRCWTMPALSNGHVYGRNADGKLACVKLPRTTAQ